MSWQPSAGIKQLRGRTEIITGIRTFLQQLDILEVDTPLLAATSVSEPHLHSFSLQSFGRVMYLQTSPEQHMKRLLASGSGDIFQICKAFRRDESGTRHNPEFTMLEWYRCGIDLPQMMQETCRLVQAVSTRAPTQVRSNSYSELFIAQGLPDPITSHRNTLLKVIPQQLAQDVVGFDHDQLVDAIFSSQIEPNLGGECLQLVTDFPAWLSALSQTHQRADGAQISQRFELYWQGVELANGYLELLDADVLQARYQQDNQHRNQTGSETVPYMSFLDQAMRHGLPQSCGVALGVDRLVMLATGCQHIDEVLAFPISRA